MHGKMIVNFGLIITLISLCRGDPLSNETVSLNFTSEWFAEQQKEVIYVISGSPKFGGHPRQMFKWPILDIIKFTGEQFNYSTTKFGVIWGNAYLNMDIVSPMTHDPSQAEMYTEAWLQNIPEPYPTALSGLAGSIAFANQNMFSKSQDVIKIVVALTNWNMLRTDVGDFLTNKCSRVIIFVLAFPWPHQACDFGRVQRMVLFMNKKLNQTGLLKHHMAYCGRRIDKLEIFRPYIIEAVSSHLDIKNWCDIWYPLDTSTTTVAPPCQNILECQPWVKYVLYALAFCAAAILCASPLIFLQFAKFLNDYRREKRNKETKKLKKRLGLDLENEREYLDYDYTSKGLVTEALEAHSKTIANSLWSFYKASNSYKRKYNRRQSTMETKIKKKSTESPLSDNSRTNSRRPSVCPVLFEEENEAGFSGSTSLPRQLSIEIGSSNQLGKPRTALRRKSVAVLSQNFKSRPDIERSATQDNDIRSIKGSKKRRPSSAFQTLVGSTASASLGSAETLSKRDSNPDISEPTTAHGSRRKRPTNVLQSLVSSTISASLDSTETLSKGDSNPEISERRISPSSLKFPPVASSFELDMSENVQRKTSNHSLAPAPPIGAKRGRRKSVAAGMMVSLEKGNLLI